MHGSLYNIGLLKSLDEAVILIVSLLLSDSAIGSGLSVVSTRYLR